MFPTVAEPEISGILPVPNLTEKQKMARLWQEREAAHERAETLHGRLIAAEAEVRHLREELQRAQGPAPVRLRAYVREYKPLPRTGRALSVGEVITLLSRHDRDSRLIAVGAPELAGETVANIGVESDPSSPTGRNVILWLGTDPLGDLPRHVDQR